MILSDTDIIWALCVNPDDGVSNGVRAGCLKIDPQGPLDEHVQPSSYDMRLGPKVARFNPSFGVVKAWEGIPEEDMAFEDRSEAGFITVRRGEFLLGHTLERVTMPHDLTARVEGRSSIGRLGVTMHVTAGYIDPGFDGQITLEIVNLSARDVQLRIGDRCCQLVLETMTSKASRPYGKARGSRFVGEHMGAVPYIKK